MDSLGSSPTRHRADLKLAFRIVVAGLVTFWVGQLLGLPRVYWAVLTAVIVMQGSVGGSFQAGLDRSLGTLGGAVWGVVVSIAIPHGGGLSLAIALAAALAPLALLGVLRPAYRAAPITAIIVLLGSSSQQAGPVASALDRVIEIGVGCIVAVVVSLLVLPARAHGLLAEAAGRVLELMGEEIDMLPARLSGGGDPTAVSGLYDRIRGAIARAETAAEEAARERAIRLTNDPDPDPLVRTLRRLRHDLTSLNRATVEALPEPVRGRLAEPVARVSAAIGAYLRAAGRALASRTPPPTLAAVDQALDVYAIAMAGVRREGLTRDLSAEAVGRIFGLSFALEQLRQNLDDLADRARALADSPR